jgi:hypothetical protein
MVSNLFSQLKNWYLKYKDQFASWFSQDRQEPTPPKQSLAELPPKLAEQFKHSIQNLSTALATQKAIQEKTFASIQQWQKQPDTTGNSLIILSSPVESIGRILSESLTELEAEIELPVRLLEWVERPTDIEKIVDKLVQQLGRGTITTTQQPREIVVISNLSWCFLRSVEGLEGIDYLKRNHFERSL